jgi:SAM-dependent methyltransferase
MTLKPEGDDGIQILGHREYVGGLWDQMGSLQSEFLRSRGLRPGDVLLDIACGSLRLGSKVIPYLERGHYLGVDKEPGLIEAGMKHELPQALVEEKSPELLVSGSFEFRKLTKRPTFAIAQSLFTHLTIELINSCFRNLRDVIASDGVFYATYFETDERVDNPALSHDHDYFAYTKSEMLNFGEANGFSATYIGDWSHPRGQKMVEYRPTR